MNFLRNSNNNASSFVYIMNIRSKTEAQFLPRLRPFFKILVDISSILCGE